MMETLKELLVPDSAAVTWTAIGAVAAIMAVFVPIIRSRLKSKRKQKKSAKISSTQEPKKLVEDLLDESMFSAFRYEDNVALTDDDAASLALISRLIEKKAKSSIKVIGRGPRSVDRRIRGYLAGVAMAILRGVDYQRILILDADLPQNGLLWLLLLERFIARPEYRANTSLFPMKVGQGHGTTLQFQIVDERYLHSTLRDYDDPQSSASTVAPSAFFFTPHPELERNRTIFNRLVARQGPAFSHAKIVELMEELLTSFDTGKREVPFHSKLVSEAVTLLDNLDVEDLPDRSVRFVGSMMPFTFTFDAAKQFAKGMREGSEKVPVAVVPYERLDDAVADVEKNVIDYVCLPTASSKLKEVIPPTVSEHKLEHLRHQHQVVQQLSVQARFVLAGKASKLSQGQRVAAVDPAYDQVESSLADEIRDLPRVNDKVNSNYDAGWLAWKYPDVIAITTPSAAEYLGLTSFGTLPDGDPGVTEFSVFSRHKKK